MKLITLRSQILEVVDRWKESYPKDKLEILKKLESLNLETAWPQDLEKIIGNPTWACLQLCYECGKDCLEVVELGEEPDWESSTVLICKDCLQKALKL